ncbi:MAG: ABC transporter permease [Planctomycetaceae bacterium]|nr:ABC transporter permease [Planctomycetaceae bacterium]
MFRFAIQNVLSRPMRTALAVLGMTVAIMGMVSLFSIAEGLTQVIGNTLSRAPGLVAMQRGAPIPLFSTLPKSWLLELESLPGISAVSPECWARANVIEGKVVVSPPRLLCGSDIRRRNQLQTGIYREDIVAGRYLGDADVGTLNCVVSRQIAEEHGKHVGDVLEVNGYELTLVGIYYTGSLLLDVAIILDDSRFREMARFDAETVSSFYIEQDGTASDEELLSRIQDHFRGRGPRSWQAGALLTGGTGNPLSDIARVLDRAIKELGRPAEGPEQAGRGSRESPPDSKPTAKAGSGKSESSVEDDPMEVRLAADWAGRIDKFAEDLDLALWLLTSLGVFIALVSVINTMLMSVTERIGEFGILRANGWSKLDLMQLIAWESFLLGISGGALGCLLGWSLTIVVNAAYPHRFNLFASPSLLLFALGFSAVLGVVSGLYPALWAARLNPMEAIRRN